MPDLGPYEIRINHRTLLDLSLGSIGLPKDVRQSAIKLLDEAVLPYGMGTSPHAHTL